MVSDVVLYDDDDTLPGRELGARAPRRHNPASIARSNYYIDISPMRGAQRVASMSFRSQNPSGCSASGPSCTERKCRPAVLTFPSSKSCTWRDTGG